MVASTTEIAALWGFDDAPGSEARFRVAAEAATGVERLTFLTQVARSRVARCMVAWVLRLDGRTDEALALQRALKGELDALGESDPYVDEEIALLSPSD